MTATASSPAIIRGATLQPRPWANGLGISHNIAQHGDGACGFGWMIATAELSGDAAFSHYPGIDRVFTIIEGQGATLTLEGSGPLRCRPFVPAGFPGDQATHCTMDGIPGRAFNLMLDRAGWRGSVTAQSLAAGHRMSLRATAIHCLAGQLAIGEDVLEAGDTMLPADNVTVAAQGAAAMALVVEVAARVG
ncbi:HutD family protein [Roseococcus sp. YIM B11640]|uniref:HutD/Ves family protein n=1 Tax=Roseococcus sp. YIM B11640 TaxID=3133973 RepID=UPI003C7AC7A3